MQGYPKNLSYIVKRLSGFSKQNFKLQTLNQTSASPGQIISLDLPSNSLVDLSTLTMFMKASTTTTAGVAVLPRNAECLIQRVEIECNGQLVSAGFDNYNQLWQIICDISLGEDATNRRKVLQNGGDVATPNTNETNKQLCIMNWLGFLGSCRPQILDTSLIGNVRIRIHLAGSNILVKSTAAAGESYNLSDIFFTVDCIDISDGIYHQLHEKYLMQGGIYEIPFKNYLSFNSVGGLSQSTKFSLSTQSLNRVFACFTPGANYIVGGAADSASHDPNSMTSSYFTRIGNAGEVTYGTATNNQKVTYTLNDYQFSVNNTLFPNTRPSADQAYAHMLNSINLSQDTLGGGYKGLDSLAKWNRSFWVAVQEFEHGDSEFISGIDTRGNIAQCHFNSVGSISMGAKTGTGHGPDGNLVCHVFAECSSVLRVGAGKQIELVL